MDKNKALINIKLLEDEVIGKREEIKSKLTFKLEKEYIKKLFYLYDNIFFESYFRLNHYHQIDFSISSKLRRSAGKTIVKGQLYSKNKNFEIRMGKTFFENFNNVSRTIKVNGIVPKDVEESFMIVLEHEIIHVIEFICFDSSNCSNRRFFNLANNIFKHRGVYHQLPTNSEINSQLLKIKIGQRVRFYYGKEILSGIVRSINKNVTVMVPSKRGNYIDSYGNKYDKIYVPPEKII